MNDIVAKHNNLVDTKEVTFTFRKVKDADTGVVTKRENIIAKLDYPSIEGIVHILNEGGKGLELLQSAVESTINDYVKQCLGDDPSITTDNIVAANYLWDVIANLPDTERRGRGIPKEVWEGFIENYIETMPSVIGKSVDVVKKQAAILGQKFQPLKNHEKKNDLLPKFVEMLTLYCNTNPEAEQYSQVIEFLLKKAEEFMNSDKSADLAENLGFE